jgi:hypothetical protein
MGGAPVDFAERLAELAKRDPEAARRLVETVKLQFGGWPMPAELPPLAETAEKDVTLSQPSQLDKKTEPKPETTLQAQYDARVTEAHAPTVAEDRAWAIAQGLTFKAVEALRKNNKDPRLHVRQRRR